MNSVFPMKGLFHSSSKPTVRGFAEREEEEEEEGVDVDADVDVDEGGMDGNVVGEENVVVCTEEAAKAEAVEGGTGGA